MIFVMAVLMALSFIVTSALTPGFIRFLQNSGITGTDIQKINRPKIAEMGGPVVLVGFLLGIFLFVWTSVFVLKETSQLVSLFAAISTIVIITMIGMFDDLGVLQRKHQAATGFGKYKRAGLKQWLKPLLTLPAAIPLMAIMAGDSTMTFPLIGTVNVGIFYPLLFVPVGIVGASNAVNMLAGFNGLEAGLGAVLMASLGIYGLMNNEIAAAAIALSFAAALAAFLRFNRFPARIMPGDSLVYAIGAAAASVAIIGNMEKFALYCFAPWFVEALLKLRSGFRAENYGLITKDGTLRPRGGGIYSLTHVVMNAGRFSEVQVSGILVLFEVLVCAAAFLIAGG